LTLPVIFYHCINRDKKLQGGREFKYGLGDGVIFLEQLSMHHVDGYFAAFSQIVQALVGVSDISAEHHYLQERLVKQQDQKTCFYCIFDVQKNQCIGAIEIRDSGEHPGQLYCWVNEHYWATGAFVRAMRLAALDYFLNTCALFFTAHVYIHNKRSYYALKKCGFADTGIFHGPWGLQYQLILRNKVGSSS